MKIRFAINARIPTPRAHGLQVMKTCEALAKTGAEVELVVPKRHDWVGEDPFSYYGVERIFRIEYLRTIDITWKGLSYAFGLQTFAFTLSLARYLRKHRGDGFRLYVRGELGWLLPLVSSERFVWENHIRPRSRSSEARALKRAEGAVVVTERYKQDLVGDHRLREDAVLVAPDAVDLKVFGAMASKDEARRKLGLPLDKKLAVYAGSDLPWKGVRTLRAAATLLPEDWEVVFVGPMESQGVSLRQRFAGLRPHGEIPSWLAAADVLVLTGDPQSETARYYTSPMKLFEYMAAGRPIVASDLPSFRDVLSEETAILVAPGDAQSLADGIVRAVGESQRAVAARAQVDRYSWERRAASIIAFMERRFA